MLYKACNSCSCQRQPRCLPKVEFEIAHRMLQQGQSFFIPCSNAICGQQSASSVHHVGPNRNYRFTRCDVHTDSFAWRTDKLSNLGCQKGKEFLLVVWVAEEVHPFAREFDIWLDTFLRTPFPLFSRVDSFKLSAWYIRVPYNIYSCSML